MHKTGEDGFGEVCMAEHKLKGKNMKTNRIIGTVALTGLALALTGCVVTSIYPYFTDKDLVIDPALLGDWVEAGATNASAEHATIERTGEKDYRVTAFTASETNSSDLHLFRLKQQLFLDICLTNRSLDYVPVHQVSKVIRIEPTIETAALNYDWLAKLLEKNPREIRHMVLREKPADAKGGRIVLTADTKELQRFILKHVNNTNAWNKPSEWKHRN
jgi:hypothetical protein